MVSIEKVEVKPLANIKSAIKRAELNVKQNEKNSAQKSAMRTAIKAFEANLKEWDTIYLQGSFFYKKYTLEQIENKSWLINYPKDGFKKGVSLILEKHD